MKKRRLGKSWSLLSQSHGNQVPRTPLFSPSMSCRRCQRPIMHQWRSADMMAADHQPNGMMDRIKRMVSSTVASATNAVVGFCPVCKHVYAQVSTLGQSRLHDVGTITSIESVQHGLMNRQERRAVARIGR